MAEQTPTLAEQLRARRKQLGLTQLDVADLSGLSLRFIHDCENGKPSVQLNKVQDLARVLGLTLNLSLRVPGPSVAGVNEHD